MLGASFFLCVPVHPRRYPWHLAQMAAPISAPTRERGIFLPGRRDSSAVLAQSPSTSMSPRGHVTTSGQAGMGGPVSRCILLRYSRGRPRGSGHTVSSRWGPGMLSILKCTAWSFPRRTVLSQCPQFLWRNTRGLGAWLSCSLADFSFIILSGPTLFH